MLTPASAATSRRRSPGTRRRPWLGRPAPFGGDVGSPRDEALADCGSVVHVAHGTSRARSLGCTVGTPLNGNLLPARGAAFLAGVTTPIRHRPRREAAASLAVAALVGLLFSVWHSPGRNAGEGRSGLASATPSASASIARGGSSPGSSERDGTSLWIDLVAGDEIATATHDDTPEARAFAAHAPDHRRDGRPVRAGEDRPVATSSPR
jgi:hypothetical protein